MFEISLQSLVESLLSGLMIEEIRLKCFLLLLIKELMPAQVFFILVKL